MNGVFDRFPGVKFVIGHMGEMIPAHLWRLGMEESFVLFLFQMSFSPYLMRLPFSYY